MADLDGLFDLDKESNRDNLIAMISHTVEQYKIVMSIGAILHNADTPYRGAKRFHKLDNDLFPLV